MATKQKEYKKNLKSNKGFTMQDLAIAIIILFLFAGTIGGIYLSIYQIQSDTKLDSIATLYTVQIMEYMDKISYKQVTNGMEDAVRQQFNIPDSFNILIDVSSYLPSQDSEDLVKQVSVTLTYHFNDSDKTIKIERLKVKEL